MKVTWGLQLHYIFMTLWLTEKIGECDFGRKNKEASKVDGLF